MSPKIERLRALFEADPKDTMTALALGEAHRRHGQDLEALVIYQEIASRCRLAEVHLALAQIYSEHGHFRQALKEIENLLKLDPHNVEARLLLEELNGPQDLPNQLLSRFSPTLDKRMLQETRERLRIQKSLLQMEYEGLKRRADMVQNQPALHFFAQEARRRLSKAEQRLARLETLDQTQSLRPRLASYLVALIQTRGVETVTLISKAGHLVEHSGNAQVSREALQEWMLEALELMDSYSDEPQAWVTECDGGVVLMQMVGREHVLLVTADRRQSYGSLRFSVHKTVSAILEKHDL